jgi:hypothetical protein
VCVDPLHYEFWATYYILGKSELKRVKQIYVISDALSCYSDQASLIVSIEVVRDLFSVYQ